MYTISYNNNYIFLKLQTLKLRSSLVFTRQKFYKLLISFQININKWAILFFLE